MRPIARAGRAGVGRQGAHQSGGDFETWDANGGGAESSQYTSLAQIDKSNVGRLAVAWSYPFGETTLPDGRKVSDNYLFNPIVVDGVMYVLGAEPLDRRARRGDRQRDLDAPQRRRGRRPRHELLGEQGPVATGGCCT